MRALLIDGMNLVHRVYAAVPGDADSDAHFEGVLSSCVASLRRALERHRPSHVVCVFDAGGPNWRHEAFPDYKRGRPPMPERLRRGLAEIEKAFAGEGVHSVAVEGFEADDVIATFAHKIAQREGNAVILSTDKTFCQLLSDHVRVFDHFADRFLDEHYVDERFGVPPPRLPTLFALVGNRSLNVSGVKSIGTHTAAKLIEDYGDLDAILAAADTIPGKLGAKIRKGREQALLAQKLLALRTDVRVGINLRELRYAVAEG